MGKAHRLIAGSVFLVAVVGALVLGAWTKGVRPARASLSARELGCGQWAVYRTCELLGVPVALGDLRKRMPVSPDGHSLLTVANVLRDAGLETTGVKESFDEFLDRTGVRIVHMRNPDHFIVVTRADSQLVFFLDHQGRRQVIQTPTLRKRWSGFVLYVEKPTGSSLLGFDRSAPKDGQARIQFDALLIDKGDILAGTNAETVHFEYPFRNLGKSELRIAKIRTTCGCLKSEKPEKPIAPGESAVIRLEYRISKTGLSFSHDAIVETNDPVNPLIALRAAGNSNVLVTVSPPALDLGVIPAGTEQSAFFIVKYNGEEGFTVSSSTPDSTLFATVHSEPPAELAERIWPGSGGRIRLGGDVRVVEVKLPPASVGAIKSEVIIRTNVKGFEAVRVPVTGRVVAPVEAVPAILSFGESAPGESLSKSLLLRSTNEKPFRVLGVSPTISGLKWSALPTEATSARVEFRATGATVHPLSGKNVLVKVESGGEQYDLELSVFAAKKAAPARSP